MTTVKELPIYDIKDYEHKFKKTDVLFDEQDKQDIPYVINRMRRSRVDAELYNNETYIYNENEVGNKALKTNQVAYIKQMAVDLDLEYDFFKGIHFVSPKSSMDELFEELADFFKNKKQ